MGIGEGGAAWAARSCRHIPLAFARGLRSTVHARGRLQRRLELERRPLLYPYIVRIMLIHSIYIRLQYAKERQLWASILRAAGRA
jgi:hypothetical protein